VAVALVTGMSGTGKSVVPILLAHNGYRTADTGHGDWIDRTGEPLLREPAIVEIETRQPLNAELDQLAALAGAADLRSST
jgi:dephospho-CoA kinase